MERGTAKQILQSVVNFLRDELSNNSLDSESAESVEVAVQCLETAYSLPCESRPILNLANVYREALATNKVLPQTSSSKSTTSSAPVVSELDKQQAESLKAMGNEFMGKDLFQESAGYYSKAIEKDPTNAVYYCNRAAAYSKLLNFEQAIADCKKALEIQPNYSKAYGRMGLAHSSLLQHEQAKECYKKAVELEPNNEGFARNLAIAEQAARETSSTSAPSQPANPFANLLGEGGGLGAALGGAGGAPNLGSLMSNPNLLNMASQLMSDPNMQNMMANILGGSAPPATGAAPPPSSAPPTADTPNPPPSQATTGAPPQGGGIEALFSAGRQLAEQMQNQHPELLAQLRSQMNPSGGQNNDQQNPPQP